MQRTLWLVPGFLGKKQPRPSAVQVSFGKREDTGDKVGQKNGVKFIRLVPRIRNKAFLFSVIH